MHVVIANVCPRSLDPIYVVTYYIKRVETSWSYSIRSVHDPSGILSCGYTVKC